jgi:hypothetical protein
VSLAEKTVRRQGAEIHMRVSGLALFIIPAAMAFSRCGGSSPIVQLNPVPAAQTVSPNCSKQRKTPARLRPGGMELAEVIRFLGQRAF